MQDSKLARQREQYKKRQRRVPDALFLRAAQAAATRWQHTLERQEKNRQPGEEPREADGTAGRMSPVT